MIKKAQKKLAKKWNAEIEKTVNILTGKEIIRLAGIFSIKYFQKTIQISIYAQIQIERKSQEQGLKINDPRFKNKFQLFVNPTTFDLFSQLELDRRENEWNINRSVFWCFIFCLLSREFYEINEDSHFQLAETINLRSKNDYRNARL